MLQRNNVRQSQKSATSYSSRGFTFFSTAASTPNYYAREQTGAPAPCRTLWVNLGQEREKKKEQNHQTDQCTENTSCPTAVHMTLYTRGSPLASSSAHPARKRSVSVMLDMLCIHPLAQHWPPWMHKPALLLRARTVATKEMGGRKSVGESQLHICCSRRSGGGGANHSSEGRWLSPSAAAAQCRIHEYRP